MIYLYKCDPCNKTTDVVKSVSDFDRVETCTHCQGTMQRQFAAPRIYLSGTAVQEKKWQPALGRPATDSELKSEAKAKGWEEIGNERPEKHLKPQRTEYPTFSDDDIRAITRNL